MLCAASLSKFKASMATLQRALVPNTPETKSNLKRTLYVGGLDDHVTKEILEAAFIPFGDIRTTAIPKDRITGKHRGFAFVEFEEEEDAQHAIFNMHDAELYGRVLTVNLARAPARQPGEGSRPGRTFFKPGLVRVFNHRIAFQYGVTTLSYSNARRITQRLLSVKTKTPRW